MTLDQLIETSLPRAGEMAQTLEARLTNRKDFSPLALTTFH